MPEESAFWTFLAILTRLLPRVIGEGGPSTEIQMVDELIRQRHPELIRNLFAISIPLRTFTTSWIICLFSTSLPPETVLRMWDCLILTSTTSCAIRLLNARNAPVESAASPVSLSSPSPSHSHSPVKEEEPALPPNEIAPNVLVRTPLTCSDWLNDRETLH